MAKRFNIRRVRVIVLEGDDAIAMSAAETDEWARQHVKELDRIDAVVQNAATF